MEKINKIRFICDVDFLKSPHCIYLSNSEKEEILNDYAEKTCLIVGAVQGDMTLFVAVYDLTPRALHVRHVVGNFGRFYRELDKFSLGLAAICGYGSLTFCSKRRAITEKWAKHAGFDRMPECESEFEFVKRAI
jgi:hypothetical protein